MNKLISMTDFVLEQKKKLKNAPDAYDQYCKIVNYAELLKEPLKKGMFVPCDEDDNVLNEPFECSCAGYVEDCIGCEFTDIKYQKAKEKILFKGFQFSFCVENITCISNKENDTNILFFNDGRILLDSKEIKTIEDLIPYNLTLIK